MFTTELGGKVALVAGGAGGIGKAIAMKLAGCGADLVVADKDIDGAKEVMSEIKAMGNRAMAIEFDLMNYNSVKAMADRAAADMGKIDICIASGGTSAKHAKFFHELDPSTDYAECMSIQQYPRLYTVRAVLDHMKKQNYGKILMITTDAGRVPTPRESLIGAAAAGLVLATKVMANEFKRWNIRVNLLCMTLVADTPALKDVMNSPARHVFEKVYDRVPFGIPTAEDIAEAALFFSSPETDRITGQILSINSGLSFPG
jgi:3-oxoacyl-[acyl-carrier protein] reductase